MTQTSPAAAPAQRGAESSTDKLDPTAKVARRGSKLELVEVGRGLAALAVVMFHSNAGSPYYNAPSFAWMSTLKVGVDFFFVLSGFIIMTAHRRQIGQPRIIGNYLRKRAIRLFPLLWLVVFLYALMHLVVHKDYSVAILLRSLIPYPSLLETAPAVVWTLRHEFLFYVIFVTLLWSRGLGLAVFTIWGGAAVIQLVLSLLGTPVVGLWSFFLSSFTLDFIFGMLVALAHQNRDFAPSFWPLVIGISLLVGYLSYTQIYHIHAAGYLDYVTPAATLGTLCLGLIFTLIVHGLVRLETVITPARSLVALGGASYAIYLVHTPINHLAQRIAIYFPQSLLAIGIGHLFLTLAGTAAGFVLYFCYERPLGSYLREKLTTSRVISSTPD